MPTASKKKRKPFSANERAFIEHYCVSLSCTEAWLNSFGKKAPNKNSASSRGKEVYSRPRIFNAIQKRLIKKRQHFSVTKEHVLSELAKMAFSNASDYFEIENGSAVLKDWKDIPHERLAAIQSISESTTAGGGSFSLKMHDKGQNLDRLARVLQLFNDDGGFMPTPEERAAEFQRARVMMDDVDSLLPPMPPERKVKSK